MHSSAMQASKTNDNNRVFIAILPESKLGERKNRSIGGLLQTKLYPLQNPTTSLFDQENCKVDFSEPNVCYQRTTVAFSIFWKDP
jgi:hypothetical protein